MGKIEVGVDGRACCAGAEVFEGVFCLLNQIGRRGRGDAPGTCGPWANRWPVFPEMSRGCAEVVCGEEKEAVVF